MKRTYVYLPLLALLACTPARLGAQAAIDAHLGFGGAHDSASSAGIESPYSVNFGEPCTLAAGTNDGFCQSRSSLGGFFMDIGGDVMFKEKFGAGFDASFQPAKQSYGSYQSRQTFYDVNGIYEPLSGKKWSLRLLGGIGGARTSFSYSEVCAAGSLTCSSQPQPLNTFTHFQVHVGVALQYFVTDHIFIQPQFDYHYVPNLTQQFGSDSVPMGMIGVGYSSGHRN